MKASRIAKWVRSVETIHSARLFAILSAGDTVSALGPRVVVGIDVFEAKRADCGHLRNVFARLRPMEMGCAARQNDHTACAVRGQCRGVELGATSHIKHARHDGIDAMLR